MERSVEKLLGGVNRSYLCKTVSLSFCVREWEGKGNSVPAPHKFLHISMTLIENKGQLISRNRMTLTETGENLFPAGCQSYIFPCLHTIFF